MDHGQVRALHPAGLPTGTQVGPWRVVGFRGQGTYGVVYRSARVGQEDAGFVALKLAVSSQDPRFTREAELLARLRHPSIPRLLDHGQWRDPAGTPYPYLVMEWVEGTPLYDWAREHNPSSRQVLHLLAQLASALAATAQGGAVHRDVKGDNVLVRQENLRAFLMDFGVGNYQGAPTLTAPAMIPGTPAYRAPQAWLSLLRFRHTGGRYVAGPADDVFALGVTAYRLVTGQYPSSIEPREDASGHWHVSEVTSPPRELNPRVDALLSALILRMLSVNPEARGTAREHTEALEQAAKRAGPEADQPLFTPEIRQPLTWRAEDIAIADVLGHRLRPGVLGNPARLRAMRRLRAVPAGEVPGGSAHLLPAPSARAVTRARALPWRPLLTAAAVALLPFLCGRWSMHPQAEEMPALTEAVPDADKPDAGSVAIGDTTLTAPGVHSRAPFGGQVLALDLPKEPLPGQLKPDTNGKCPVGSLVVINGGCWLGVNAAPADCTDVGGYLYKGRCYQPVRAPERQPTSTPPVSR